jgi:hypothetical protein
LALNLAANAYQLTAGNDVATPPAPSSQVVQIFEGNINNLEILQLSPGNSSSGHVK